MDVFNLRDKIIREDFAGYAGSFLEIADERIRGEVENKFKSGALWPEPLLQLNPAFADGGDIESLVEGNVLHPKCAEIFRRDKSDANPRGDLLRLYKHQREAIAVAGTNRDYVLTTGTGSGKSLAYIVPIVDYILKNPGRGIKAIIVYPMNALANSQELELEKFLRGGDFPVTFRRYTGQENEDARREIVEEPPDIILTNYVMLELILTRPHERRLVDAARNLKFLVFDELHTYRGRQGADVALLIRRLRATLNQTSFVSVGTSATLAGPGTRAEKQARTAELASRIFGSEVRPENVIMETLRAETGPADPDDPAFVAGLTDFLNSGAPLPATYKEFVANPLAAWIEATVGVARRDGELERATPRPLKGKDGLAASLAALTGVAEERCAAKIRDALLTGSRIMKPGVDKPVFAFKLHQFVGRGDSVYATIEPEDARYITLSGQKLAPGREGETPLYPLKFCRECGKEYYEAALIEDGDEYAFAPGDATGAEEEGVQGFLFIDAANPWPEGDAALEKIPDDWLAERKGKVGVARDKKNRLPRAWFVKPDGTASKTAEPGATLAWFMPDPFGFCPSCGVAYGPRVDDFSKLGSLGFDGRTTATTILSMSTVNRLREEADLAAHARKFLCFSDNRQDASLQAGHFNDFIATTLVRSAIYNALLQAGPEGLGYDELPEKVFKALGVAYADGRFPMEYYALRPDAKFSRANKADKAFRGILEYLIYCDLRRGWRVVAPNLEQCGLLRIEYDSLTETCADDSLWSGELLAAAPEKRERIAVALLDHLRGKLALKADALEPARTESIAIQSRSELIPPWRLEEGEKIRAAAYARPRARKADDNQGDLYVTSRGDFGKWLKKSENFPGSSAETRNEIIASLFRALFQAGIIDATRGGADDPAYQLSASALRWKAGDGEHSVRDRLRVSRKNESAPPNSFFVALYRDAARTGGLLRSREHTAQVSAEDRETREAEFRDATLPVLYCSPTMELGVDIRALNVVGMRNIPPTPANYAQRSGRAGRGGEPALILAYCARGSSHDQYFFRAPERMVAGAVAEPRIDLANEDLLEAHIRALWLAESGLDLKSSLADLLDIAGENPTLDLKESVIAALNDQGARDRAAVIARQLLAGIEPDLADCPWYDQGWLARVVKDIPARFEQACERWRANYRAAVEQTREQERIVNDASNTRDERNKAESLRRDALRQRDMLISKGAKQNDFYSYRYFASEGFLPGYNFPRLPLTAFIPAQRIKGDDGDSISRPRFLAISEFGPSSVVYHEGAKYIVTGVRMGADDRETLGVKQVKLCDACAYLNPPSHDVCEMCGSRLPAPLDNMFRARDVRTTRRDRITSDEEERLRFGYQLVSGYSFADGGGYGEANVADAEGKPLAALKYARGANLCRINLGWLKRPATSRPGFLLDRVKGSWLKDGQAHKKLEAAQSGLADPAKAASVDNVIPYVEDRRNCLTFVPASQLTPEQAISLATALEQAIQIVYQLEDAELTAEVLPSKGEPRTILFVENAEGGAGVLRRLVENGPALAEVAREALNLCHYTAMGEEQVWDENAEPCVAACYDCLLTYGNQRFHKLLDRRVIKDLLLALAGSRTAAATAADYAESLARLKRRCASELERRWLDFLAERSLRLPDRAQYRVERCGAVPDFWYDKGVAVYIDGPCHDYPDRRARDLKQSECLEDLGITVIRFAGDEQWPNILQDNKDIFGEPESKAKRAANPKNKRN